MNKLIKYFFILLVMTLICNLYGCQDSKNYQVMNIAAIKGPTALGIVKLMDNNQKYNISVVNDPSEAAAKISMKEVDVALIPTNMASILYNKSNREIKVAAINTLGVLYILSLNNNIKGLNDLKGKTIYVSGQGATPEYALKYVLKENSIDPDTDLTIEYKSEHAQLAALLASERVELAVLPEPFVTQVINKNSNVKVILDLTKEWKNISKGNTLTMGCVAVNIDFVEKNKDKFNEFLNEYKESVKFVNNQVSDSAYLADKYGIMDESVAKQAIPKCNVVFIDGNDMKVKVGSFLKVLWNFDPKSVGGELPDDSFFY